MITDSPTLMITFAFIMPTCVFIVVGGFWGFLFSIEYCRKWSIRWKHKRALLVKGEAKFVTRDEYEDILREMEEKEKEKEEKSIKGRFNRMKSMFMSTYQPKQDATPQ